MGFERHPGRPKGRIDVPAGERSVWRTDSPTPRYRRSSTRWTRWSPTARRPLRRGGPRTDRRRPHWRRPRTGRRSDRALHRRRRRAPDRGLPPRGRGPVPGARLLPRQRVRRRERRGPRLDVSGADERRRLRRRQRGVPPRARTPLPGGRRGRLRRHGVGRGRPRGTRLRHGCLRRRGRQRRRQPRGRRGPDGPRPDHSDLPPATVVTAGFDPCATRASPTPTDWRTRASRIRATTTRG